MRHTEVCGGGDFFFVHEAAMATIYFPIPPLHLLHHRAVFVLHRIDRGRVCDLQRNRYAVAELGVKRGFIGSCRDRHRIHSATIRGSRGRWQPHRHRCRIHFVKQFGMEGGGTSPPKDRKRRLFEPKLLRNHKAFSTVCMFL